MSKPLFPHDPDDEQEQRWKEEILRIARQRSALRDAGEPGVPWEEINARIEEMLQQDDE